MSEDWEKDTAWFAFKEFHDAWNELARALAKEFEPMVKALNDILSSESHELDIIGPVKESDFNDPTST